MIQKLLYMKTPVFIILSILLLFVGCNDTDKVAVEIAKIDVDMTLTRFDREFAKVTEAGLPLLKNKYSYLFPTQYPDSVWVNKINDSIQMELFQEVGKTFPSFEEEKDGLEALFQHVKYYFPKLKTPNNVVTVTSEVDYNNQVILADTLLFIGLDTYLGANHHFYQDIQNYIALGLDKKYIVSDVAKSIGLKVVPRLQDRTFLSSMVYHGKLLFIKDKLMPNASDVIRMKYTEDQFAWAEANEEAIWRNFIEQEHLYSTDSELRLRFIEDAPFSKFGLELDNESPGRLGQYIGWQIVRSFMRNNDITLEQLLKLPAEDIFKKSKYKPRK